MSDTVLPAASGRMEACGLGSCPPEWEVVEGGSVFSRIYRVDGGQATYDGPGGTVPLRQGFLYLFPAHSPYRIRQDPDHPLECLWFHVTLFPIHLRTIVEIPLLPDRADHALLAAAEAMFREGAPRNRIHLVVEALLQGFAERGILPAITDPRVLAALRCIHDGFRVPLALSDIAVAAGFHPRHLIRLFHRHIGWTPHRYLLLYRLRQASLLLEQGVPVGETALLCGFSDSKAFGRAFRSQFGMTPSVYRRRPSRVP